MTLDNRRTTKTLRNKHKGSRSKGLGGWKREEGPGSRVWGRPRTVRDIGASSPLSFFVAVGANFFQRPLVIHTISAKVIPFQQWTCMLSSKNIYQNNFGNARYGRVLLKWTHAKVEVTASNFWMVRFGEKKKKKKSRTWTLLPNLLLLSVSPPSSTTKTMINTKNYWK